MNEDKASRYHRLRRRAELLGTLVTAILLFTLLISGGSLWLREAASMLAGTLPPGFEEPGTAPAMALALTIALNLAGLPIAYFVGFTLEHRYGLSNQTRRVWSLDYLKATAIAIVLSMAAAAVVYAALRWSADWWWAMSAAVFVLGMVALVRLAPVLLLPMFYRITPLDRPPLRDRLLTLARRAGTNVVGVFIWGLSAHTKKANAALTGMGGSRRILLSDTLLADYSDEEIEVVLAHELSHHVHRDLWVSVALQSALLVVTFYVAHLVLNALADWLALRGVDDPAGLPLLVLTAGVCSVAFLPVANAVSRAQERRADRYALELTNQPLAFVSAMKRLSQQNLAEEHPSPLITWMYYSHPPIRERIAFARDWEVHPSKLTAGTKESEVA
jgi:STE24 endopeptidase